MNYILSDVNNPDSHYPNQLKQIDCALRWINENADEYGFDLDEFYMGGASAGSHLSMLYSLNQDAYEDTSCPINSDLPIIKKITAIVGPSNISIPTERLVLRDEGNQLRETFTGVQFSPENLDLYGEISPINYLTTPPNSIKYLLMYAREDMTVGYDNHAIPLFNRMDEFGYDVRLETVSGDHDFMNYDDFYQEIIYDFLTGLEMEVDEEDIDKEVIDEEVIDEVIDEEIMCNDDFNIRQSFDELSCDCYTGDSCEIINDLESKTMFLSDGTDSHEYNIDSEGNYIYTFNFDQSSIIEGYSTNHNYITYRYFENGILEKLVYDYFDDLLNRVTYVYSSGFLSHTISENEFSDGTMSINTRIRYDENMFFYNDTKIYTDGRIVSILERNEYILEGTDELYKLKRTVYPDGTIEEIMINQNNVPIDSEIDWSEFNTLHLFSGDGNHEKEDILVIIEGLSRTPAEAYLEGAFGNYEFSLFKTNPFRNKEDKFNIYYYLIPEIEYSSGMCSWSNFLIEDIWRFDDISSQYDDWVDYKIYVTKDPQTWPHASSGNYIKISTTCNNYGEIEFFSKTITHEFGHMFGLLKDEYVSNNLLLFDKNCASSEIDANERWGNILGYGGETYLGCTTQNSLRGTESSIMKSAAFYDEMTWAGAWGPINEYYLERRLE